MASEWLAHRDPLLAFLLLALFFAAATEFGYRLMGRSEKTREERAFVLATFLSVLGLLIGFTLSIAINNYSKRNSTIVAEANAWGTAAFDIELLPEPYRSELLKKISAYVDLRLDGFPGEVGPAQNQRILAAQLAIWHQFNEALARKNDVALSVALRGSVSQALDAASDRDFSARVKIPKGVLDMVILTATIACLLLGGRFSAHTIRTRLLASLLPLLLAASIGLIIDIDTMQSGRVRAPAQPMLDLKQTVEALLAQPPR